jgi:hypothetical protein
MVVVIVAMSMLSVVAIGMFTLMPTAFPMGSRSNPESRVTSGGPSARL